MLAFPRRSQVGHAKRIPPTPRENSTGRAFRIALSEGQRAHPRRRYCSSIWLCSSSLHGSAKRWSLEEVAKLLGHTSTRTTEMYAHFLDSTLTDLAAQTHAAWSISTAVGLSNGAGVTTGGRPVVVTPVGLTGGFLQ
ncbi:MAG: hypothetical protein ACHREM_17360 [Polyangiales bacterium]